MDALTAALAGLQAAVELVQLYERAAAAAQAGEEAEAREYLARARDRWNRSVAAWDAAPGAPG